MTSYQKRFGHNLLRHRKLRRFIVLMHRYATLQIIRQANDAHKKRIKQKTEKKKQRWRRRTKKNSKTNMPKTFLICAEYFKANSNVVGQPKKIIHGYKICVERGFFRVAAKNQKKKKNK